MVAAGSGARRGGHRGTTVRRSIRGQTIWCRGSPACCVETARPRAAGRERPGSNSAIPQAARLHQEKARENLLLREPISPGANCLRGAFQFLLRTFLLQRILKRLLQL